MSPTPGPNTDQAYNHNVAPQFAYLKSFSLYDSCPMATVVLFFVDLWYVTCCIWNKSLIRRVGGPSLVLGNS